MYFVWLVMIRCVFFDIISDVAIATPKLILALLKAIRIVGAILNWKLFKNYEADKTSNLRMRELCANQNVLDIKKA